jgi:hypothetical protein
MKTGGSDIVKHGITIYLQEEQVRSDRAMSMSNKNIKLQLVWFWFPPVVVVDL